MAVVIDRFLYHLIYEQRVKDHDDYKFFGFGYGGFILVTFRIKITFLKLF